MWHRNYPYIAPHDTKKTKSKKKKNKDRSNLFN